MNRNLGPLQMLGHKLSLLLVLFAGVAITGPQALAQITIEVVSTPSDDTEAPDGYLNSGTVLVGVDDATVTLPVDLSMVTVGGAFNALFDTDADGVGDTTVVTLTNAGELVRVVAATPGVSTGTVQIDADDGVGTGTVQFFYGAQQTVLFTNIGAQVFIDTPIDAFKTLVPLVATAVGDDAVTTITFTSNNAVAVITNQFGVPAADGTFARLDSTGTASITATSSRTDDFLSASATDNFAVNFDPDPQFIRFTAPESVKFGDYPFVVEATAVDENGAPTGTFVTLSLISGPGSATNIVNPDPNASILVTALGSGAISIRATASGGNDFEESESVITIPVEAINTSTGALILDQWTWRNPQPTPADGSFNDFIAAEGVLVAVGDSLAGEAQIFTSLDGITWSAIAGLPDADLLSVTHGNGTFVAVGAGGAVLTSPDAVTWTQQVSGTATDLHGVTHDNGMIFVAVGASGEIIRTVNNGVNWNPAAVVPNIGATDLNAVVSNGVGNLVAVGENSILRSTDAGDNWSTILLGLSFSLNDVLIDDDSGVYVAVGGNSAILTSPTGTFWSTEFTGANFELTGIAQGNGFFVAVGEGGRLVTSPDLNTWTQRTSRFEIDFQGVGFGNGAFIAVGDGFSIFSSPTGEGWTIRDSVFDSQLEDVAFGAGVFVSVGEDGVILTSTDGISWGDATFVPVATDLRGVAFGGSTFVAVGAGGVILTSADGETWAVAADSGSTTLSDLRSIVFSEAIFVAVGDDFTIITSTDGNTWTSITSGFGNDFNAVAANNGRFVAVGDIGLVYVSDDAVLWTPVFSGVGIDLEGIASDGESFVAVGDDGIALFSSTGDAWTSTNTGIEGDLQAITASPNGVYVATGEDFSFLTSRNGIDWSSQISGSLNTLHGIGFGNGLFVAVGDFESILTSSDVINSGLDSWTFANPVIDGTTVNDVLFAGGRFVAVGDGGLILISSDGETWEEIDSGTTNNLNSVSYGSNTYIVVGENVILRSVDGGDSWGLNINWLVDFQDVEFNGGRFVAVGGGGTGIFTNNLGLNWSLSGMNVEGADLFGITYGGGWWVTVGSASENTVTSNIPEQGYNMTAIAISRDGISWTRRIAPVIDRVSPVYYTDTLRDVQFGNGVFLAAGDNLIIRTTPSDLEEDDPVIFTETNDEGEVTKLVHGTRWSLEVVGSSNWQAIAYGEPSGSPTFVLVNDVGGAFTTEDGNSYVISFPGISEAFTGVTFGNNEFIASAENGRILTSPNGDRWTVRSTAFLQPLNAVNSNAPESVAVGDNGVIFVSEDSTTWTEATNSRANPLDLNGTAFGNGRHVAVGDNGWITTSSDGNIWRPENSSLIDELNGVVYGNGNAVERFVTVGENGAIGVSDDGVNWTPGTPLIGNLNAVANGENTFITVGDNATIYTSETGLVWSNSVTITGDLSGNLNGVTFGNGIFVLVGQAGVSAFSTDSGVNWTVASTGVSTELLGITFGDGVFVATGMDGTIVTSTDGETWRKRFSNSLNRLNAVGFNDETFTSVGAFSTILASKFSNRIPQEITFDAIPDQALGTGPIPLAAIADSGLPVTYFVIQGSATIQNGNQLVLSETAGIPSIVTIRATQPGDDEFSPADPVDRSFSIINRLQSITFPPIADVVFGETTEIALGAESIDEITGQTTNLPITYTVTVGAGQAVISDAGNSITIAGAGDVTVRASQPGDDTYAAADSVNRSFTIEKADQQITFPEIAPRGINQFPFAPPATSFRVDSGSSVTSQETGLGIVYTIVSGPAIIVGNQIQLNSAVVNDVITVQANQPGDTNYNAATPQTQDITLIDKAQVITFVNGDITSVKLSEGTLDVEATSSEGADITYSIPDGPSTVAAFEGGPADPTLTLLTIGEVTIRASAAATVDFDPTFRDLTITVTGDPQTIGFPAISDKFSTDPPFELAATATSGLDIVYSVTAGGDIATVSGSTVTLTGGSGTVTITANQPGNAEFAPADPASQSFNVIEAEIGDSWTLQTSPVTTNLTGTGFAGQLFFATGENSTILTATDGTDWSSRAGGSSVLKDIAVGGTPAVYVAVGAGGIPLRSSDGINWQFISSPIAESLNSVIFAAGRFVTVGDNGFLAVSFDGLTWITVATDVTANLEDILFTDNRFVVAGGNTVLISDDSGQSWSATEFSTDFQLNAISTSGSELLAVGDDFLVITSTDNGSSWLVRPASSTNDLNSVAYGAGRFIVVGSGGGIFTSSDAISWEARDSGTTNALQSISFVDDIFVAVGDAGTILTSGGATIKGTQSINFAAIPDPASGSSTTTLTATASSGLTVSFDVIDGSATISNVQNNAGVTTATLTLSGTPGVVTVRASQIGNGSFYAAPNQDQSITIDGNSQVFADLSPAAGNLSFSTAPYTLSAISQDASTSEPTGLAVNFELISGDATLSGNALTLNTSSVGSTVVVRAFNDGNATYEPLSQNITYSIVQETVEIVFENIENKLLTDADFFITAKTSNGEDVGIRTIAGSNLVSLRTFVEEDLAGNRTVRHQVGIKGTNDATGLVTFEAFTTSLNSASAPSVTQSFFISRFTQNITFSDVGQKTFGDGDFDINATADGGGPVTLSIADDTVATLDGTTVSIQAAGVVTILATAEASSNGEYGPAEAELMITVAKAPQELQFDEIDDQFAVSGTTVTLRAQTFINGNEQPASESDFPIVYSIVTGQNRATVSGNILTLNGTEGTVTVQAAQAGNGNVNPATVVQRTFSVSSFGRIRFTGNVTIRGSAFGNSKHVAVGDEGFIFTSDSGSSDVQDWRFVAGPTTVGLQDIAFGLGQFVAVGFGGQVINSTNGLDWNLISLGDAGFLNGITFGNSRFVAAGPAGTGYTSTDGSVWSQINLGDLRTFESVAYGTSPSGDPVFVAVGQAGAIVSSNDGINWTTRNSGTLLTINSVTYGNGLFVAVGALSTYFFSSDGGVTWQRSSIPEQTLAAETLLESISFGTASFKVVGPNGLILTASPLAIVSPFDDDGVSRWQKEVSIGEQTLFDVSFGGDRFVTVGENVTILISLPEIVFSTALETGAGFRWSEWFGLFYGESLPWMYHVGLGWLYVGGDESSLWFYSDSLGWMWTAKGIYPWVFRGDTGEWLFYAEETSDPRAFFNGDTGEWELL